MRLDKLVYSVREALKEYNDDSDLSDRFIIFLLDTKRARLLTQKLNSYTTKVPSTAVQTLCIELEDANRYKCGIDITCSKIRRTVTPLPKFFDTVTGSSLLNVKSLDIIGPPFNLINSDLVPYVEYSPYNNRVFTFLDDDNYLYAYSTNDSHKFLECVEVQGVFETPLDLENFKNCCGCTDEEAEECFTADSEYPIPGEMVDVIRAMVIDDIVKLKDLKEDKENDSRDD